MKMRSRLWAVACFGAIGAVCAMAEAAELPSGPRLLEAGTVSAQAGAEAEQPGAKANEAGVEAPCRPISTARFNWYDSARRRNVPALVFYPSDGSDRAPVIIYSHGLGRSPGSCAYLGRYWARYGYCCVHLQHFGSDESVWRGKLRPMQALKMAYANSQNHYNRPEDVSFAIDQLQRLRQEQSPVAQRMDLGRIGVAGNDLGAQTALALAGQLLPGGRHFTDPRVKAIVALSPPVLLGRVPLDEAYTEIHVPCLHVRGTEDDGRVGTTQAWQRRVPFDRIEGSDQYLITLVGADHMVYDGHVLARRDNPQDPMFRRLVQTATTAFWDAYLKGDASKTQWLEQNGLRRQLGGYARLEHKPGASDTLLTSGGPAR